MTIRAIDLFCGAGGSSTGAKKAGVEIVAGFDMWQPAAYTFRENFSEAVVIDKDIRGLSTRSIRRKIGKIDLILASPECTNHSVAKGAAERDEESRMTAFQVSRFAKEFHPQWIVLENVTEMAHWNRHDELLDTLAKLGYNFHPHIFNAQEFLVPQSRKRLFLVCSRSPIKKIASPSPNKFMSVSEVLDRTGKYQMSPLRKLGRASATIARADRAIEALGSEEPFLIVYYGSDGSGGWQRIDRPLRTITTLDRFAYVEPSADGHLMRMLQPEELKLAMGYDRSFKLDLPRLSRRDKIKLMGNGVCPPVMEHIVRTLTE
jgi:DNA (cytosine-5)-methyltransferase 1